MEWIKALLEKHTKEEKLDLDGFMAELKAEFPKNAVPKDTYNALAETKKKLDADLADRDKQLDELKKTAGASDDLKKQIEQLQADNKTAAEKHAADLKEITLTNAIKLAVAGKVHDEALVAGLVDKEKLVIAGEKVVGLDEQLTSLQESKAFLFKPADGGDDKNKPGFKVGADGTKPPDPNAKVTLREAVAAGLQMQGGGGQAK